MIAYVPSAIVSDHCHRIRRALSRLQVSARCCPTVPSCKVTRLTTVRVIALESCIRLACDINALEALAGTICQRPLGAILANRPSTAIMPFGDVTVCDVHLGEAVRRLERMRVRLAINVDRVELSWDVALAAPIALPTPKSRRQRSTSASFVSASPSACQHVSLAVITPTSPKQHEEDVLVHARELVRSRDALWIDDGA